MRRIQRLLWCGGFAEKLMGSHLMLVCEQGSSVSFVFLVQVVRQGPDVCSRITHCVPVRQEGSQMNSLTCYPTPKLERFLSNAPTSREVAELANMRRVMGKRKRMLIVVQVQLHNLDE